MGRLQMLRPRACGLPFWFMSVVGVLEVRLAIALL